MPELTTYKSKRDFSQTPEPSGIKSIYTESNRFVIQLHRARRLHYDFRLQSGDVLISWAIPKEPVHDPKVKRLAVKVEDHPLDYIHFEGNIPDGNYGAGTVMVWDIGYYYIHENRSVPNSNELEELINKGSLSLYLVGARMKGKFNLVKIKKSDKDEWLFIKAEEETKEDDEERARSVITGRTMEEIKAAGKLWDPKKNEEKKPGSPLKTFAGKLDFPGFIEPMLATPLADAFSRDGWIFELKLDGFRIISGKFQKKISLYSRNGNLFNEKYPLIADELNRIKADFVLDGEVCFLDPAGKTDFQELQNDAHDPNRIHYYLFDILWLNGHDLKSIPLIQRKELLQELLRGQSPHLHFLEYIAKDGCSLFEKIKTSKQEGIIAKKSDSLYYPSFRSKEWLKIKSVLRQEMIICGLLDSDKPGYKFKSLICGLYDSGELIYSGRVGTGFTQKMQDSIYNLLKPLFIAKTPLSNPPSDKNIRWVKPEVVCEVRFTEWTKERVMRHPSFIGLREDKKPDEVHPENPLPVNKIETRVSLSNPEKLLWPEEKISKSDLFEYYKAIAPFILPYLKDRPQSLYRTPDGIAKKGFFQKNVSNIAPDWAQTVNIKSSEGKFTEYLLCNDMDSLLFMVNLGCIEINPWSSSLPNLDNPDYMVFDLDPVDVGFKAVAEVAHHVHDVLNNLGFPSYLKTSGSRGLHIYVPTEPNYSYPQVQDFVKIIESHVHQQTKSLTSFERSPSKRKGKIYLDYLQNGKGKTMASVYSVRPKSGATVSTPLTWEELTPESDPGDFTIHTLPRRIKEKGDLWKNFFEERVDLGKL